jgi:hypothetical protein
MALLVGWLVGNPTWLEKNDQQFDDSPSHRLYLLNSS